MPNRPRPGELLVAAAGAVDESWEQSVILLLDCDETGSLGVILNRVAPMPLEDVLPQWQPLVCPPQVLFSGGPVSSGGAVCLAKLLDPTEEPPGWRRIRTDLGLLHLDTPTELVDGAFADLRIFAGYSGWEAGQLEGELLRGDWHRVPSRDEDIFGATTEGLWRRVLRRQGGQLGCFSSWTVAPEQN